MKDIQLKEQSDKNKYLKCEVRLDDHYPDDVVFLSYTGKNIAVKGEISAFVGKAKARKSFFVALMMKNLLGTEKDERWRSHFDGKCLYFDSEQSRSRVKKIMQRLEKMSVDTSKHLFRSVRSLTTEEKLSYLRELLKENEEVQYVIIDNIRDLLPSGDINNQADATKVVGELLKIAEDTGTHISVVLHTNPQPPTPGEKPKPSGAVGTRLTQVCSSVIYVEKKDEETSVVSPMEMRDGDFDEFAFKIDMFDDLAVPVYVGNDPRVAEMQEAKEQTRLAKAHYNDQQKMRVLLGDIIKEDGKLTTEGLRDALYKSFQEMYDRSVPASREQMRKDISSIFHKKWSIITKASAKAPWRIKQVDLGLIDENGNEDLPF